MLLLTPALAAFIGTYFLTLGRPNDAMILFLAGALTLIVSAMFTVPCRYTILDDAVSVRCGILFYQIPFSDVVSIEPSGTWLSGPALSMRRVLITTTKRKVIISPREREHFMEDLRSSVAASNK
ncbi:MAG: PH domain-containing protein [Rubripirellula sp.]